MMIRIPGVLESVTVAEIRRRLDAADWQDGNATSGLQSAQAKRNRQLDEADPLARSLGTLVLDALARNPVFISAALPAKIFPPLFSRYETDDGFASHVDNAIRPLRGTDFRIRTDLSATLFLSGVEDYDGGELEIEDSLGVRRVKLPAGDMVLYPSSTLHRVTPITRGVRVASFFWLQSLVRESEARQMLFQADGAIQSLAQRHAPDDQAILQLTSVYHNLLRRWADC